VIAHLYPDADCPNLMQPAPSQSVMVQKVARQTVQGRVTHAHPDEIAPGHRDELGM